MTNNKPEVAQIVKWGLNTVTAVALAVGAWYFNNINNNVSDLTMAVNGLKTEVALQRQSASSELSHLRASLDDAKKSVVAVSSRLAAMEKDRFTEEEGRDHELRIRELERAN